WQRLFPSDSARVSGWSLFEHRASTDPAQSENSPVRSVNFFKRGYKKRRKSLSNTAWSLPRSEKIEFQFGVLSDDQRNTGVDENATSTIDAVRAYLKDVGSVCILTRDQELTLINQIRSGEAEIAAETLSSLIALQRVL